MEAQKDIAGMLALVNQPGFCVIENQITALNTGAERLFLTAGTDFPQLLLTGREEYAAFRGGCLYLVLEIGGQPRDAVVTRVGSADIVLLESDCSLGELRALALAAQELRKNLNNVMSTMDTLAPLLQSPEGAEQLSRLNRGMYRLLRLAGNMSDAGWESNHQETRNIGKLLEEIFQKAEPLVERAGLTLRYEGLKEAVYCLADGEQLERAVLNILSNAIKFTPAGGTIEASVTRQDRMLRLSIRDSGSGISQELLGTLFTRYLRQPAIEDSRFGLGLGMVLVRSAAAAHGGTVLVDQPGSCGTRITMTLAIRQSSENRLHSPVLRVDYTGERDHGLVELSDCLPADLYKIEL